MVELHRAEIKVEEKVQLESQGWWSVLAGGWRESEGEAQECALGVCIVALQLEKNNMQAMSFSPFLITQELVIQSAICVGDAGDIKRGITESMS